VNRLPRESEPPVPHHPSSDYELIAAPERYVIILEGKLWNTHRRHIIATGGLPNLLERLLTGDTVTAAAFASFGIRISIEEGTDQGDDGPDDLSIRR